MPGWTVEVDRDVCLGCGVCAAYAPGAFDQDEDGIVVFLGTSAETSTSIRAAVDGCPTGALRLVADDLRTDEILANDKGV